MYELATAEAAPAAGHLSGEEERVVFWRAEVLERAGYDDRAILQLAVRTDVDLHLAVELVARGCSPETAVLILL
jgi:hypothetical protein